MVNNFFRWEYTKKSCNAQGSSKSIYSLQPLFLCDRQSLICHVNRGMAFFICELPRLNTPYSYCVSTSPQLYRQYLHPQRYFYAGYLMHHLHLHSELVHCLSILSTMYSLSTEIIFFIIITVKDWYGILIPEACF